MNLPSEAELCDQGDLAYCEHIANKARTNSQHAVSVWREHHGVLSPADKVYLQLQEARAKDRRRALVRLRAKLCASGDHGACQNIVDESIAAIATKHLSDTAIVPREASAQAHTPPPSCAMTCSCLTIWKALCSGHISNHNA
jgi:hypothetical protein